MNDLKDIKNIISKLVSLVVLIFLIFMTFVIGVGISGNDERQAQIETQNEIKAEEVKVKDAEGQLEVTKKDKSEIQNKIDDIEKFLKESTNSSN